MSTKNFIKPIIKKRIPQILGVYVAGVWLCVEIADWVSERFNILPDLSAFVFIVLACLIPAVIFVAWGHGQPGKDQWTWPQSIFFSTNLLLAVVVAYSVAIKVPLSANTKSDLSTAKVSSLNSPESTGYLGLESSPPGLNQKVSMFFWSNKTEDPTLDWLSYGVTWLLGQDIKRTPYVSVQNPFDSDNMRLAIQDKGYQDAVDEPLPLSLQIAEKNSSQWLIRGQVTKEQEKLTFEASLYDVISGTLVKTVSLQSNNWLTALDYISNELSTVMLANNDATDNQIPQLSIQDHVSSNMEAIQYVVKALTVKAFDNDYPKAIKALQEALKLDAGLAEAYVIQMRLFMEMGEFEKAQRMAQHALDYDFKLYAEDVFQVTASLYGVTGEEDKALKVLESWVKEYPESAQALLSLGNNLIMKGNRIDDANQVFSQLKDIEPNSKHLLRLSQIYILKNQIKKAELTIRDYLEHYPNDKYGLVSLGSILQRQGDFEGAADAFEQAVLTHHNDFQVGIKYALNISMKESPEEAIKQLNQLLERAKNSQQMFDIYLALEQVYLQKGQIEAALNILELAKPHSKKVQSHIAHIMNYHAKRISYMMLLGQFESAEKELLELKQNTLNPFNEMLVFIDLAFQNHLDDKVGLQISLEKAEAVIDEFKMSIYQQFIYNYEAIIYRLQKRYDEALISHNKAITESKQSYLALNNRQVLDDFRYEKADTLYQAQQYKEALNLIEDVLKSRPRYAEATLLKVKILMAQGQTSQASQVAKQLQDYWQDANPEYIEYKDFLKIKQSLAI